MQSPAPDLSAAEAGAAAAAAVPAPPSANAVVSRSMRNLGVALPFHLCEGEAAARHAAEIVSHSVEPRQRHRRQSRAPAARRPPAAFAFKYRSQDRCLLSK